MKKLDAENKLEISGVLIIILALVFIRDIQAGVFLGILTTICMGMTYAMLPEFIKRTICRFRIAIDLLLAVAVPLWFGNLTATAVVGGGVNSILVSVLLNEENRRYLKIKAQRLGV